MFRLLIDQNFDHRIIRGLRLRVPDLDVAFAHEVGLENVGDPALLDWAAGASRVTVSHDFRTLPLFAYSRVALDKTMPGVIIVRTSVPIGTAIEELLMILQCCREDELERQVYIIPL